MKHAFTEMQYRFAVIYETSRTNNAHNKTAGSSSINSLLDPEVRDIDPLHEDVGDVLVRPGL